MLSIGFAIAFGCGKTDSPQHLAEQAKALGVYIPATDSLLEIAGFGVEDHNVLTETMTFKFNAAILKLKNVPQYFVVNMPNANITESKLFWLGDLKTSKWHYFNPTDDRDPKPIKSSTEPLTTGLYKVAPAEGATGQHGFLCLWLKMPPGTPDRMYAVEIEIP